jgi:4-hydroxythreonine-4-phosphate dehydrogenase
MSALSQRPPIVISMGDPAGIGPEIVCQALQRHPAWWPDVVVAGDAAHLRRAADCVGWHAPWQCFATLDAACAAHASGPRLWQACEPRPLVAWGRVAQDAGRMALACIEAGARAALAGEARALVTAPVHKEALSLAGCPHPGHTELLQALAAEHLGCRVADLPVRMMLSNPRLKTVLMSIHVSLRQALDSISADGLRQTLAIVWRHFERLGHPSVRVAVAGVNPHAGEGGLFGREEIEVLQPVIAALVAEGRAVSGPFAPDTVFWRAIQGEFDVVVAMYHDQGLIPVKLFGLEEGVNTTLGLPLVRTSPDHGTAFDRAGTGSADSASLEAAIREAMAAT